MTSAAHRALLLAHPDTPGEWVWSIAADVQLEAGVLVCHYALHGEVNRLRVPAVRAGRRADELWQHTCFEVFAAGEPGARTGPHLAPHRRAPRAHRAPASRGARAARTRAAAAPRAHRGGRGRRWYSFLLGPASRAGQPRFPRSRRLHAR